MNLLRREKPSLPGQPKDNNYTRIIRHGLLVGDVQKSGIPSISTHEAVSRRLLSATVMVGRPTKP